MVKSALIVASVASMIKQFNMKNIDILQNLDYEVTIATNFIEPGNITYSDSKKLINDLTKRNVCCKQIDFPRGVGNVLKNLKAITQLNKLKKEKQFDIVHCQSPIGGVLSRIVFNKNNTNIIYTAHGFHFFKGGPKVSWFIFYPIERILSHNTDVILTINNDDTKIAKKFNSAKIIQIPGVGIDWEGNKNIYYEKNKKNSLKKFNLPDDAKVMISIGELSDNKNHIKAMEAMALIKNPNLVYLIAGIGKLESDLRCEINRLGLENHVILLGYVDDKFDLFSCADFSYFCSKREGLGLAGLEAMSAGLPLISSNVGGIKDYMADGKTGIVVQNPEDEVEISNAITKLLSLSSHQLREISLENISVSKKYDTTEVDKILRHVYGSLIKEKRNWKN